MMAAQIVDSPLTMRPLTTAEAKADATRPQRAEYDFQVQGTAQLWERVAERGWALDDHTTVERNQVWPWRHGDNRGPQIPAVAWPEVARHTSGIIRAGERIK